MSNIEMQEKIIEGTFTINLSVLKSTPYYAIFSMLAEEDQRAVFNTMVKDLIGTLNQGSTWATLSVEV